MMKLKLAFTIFAILIVVAAMFPAMDSRAKATPSNQTLCPVMGFEITTELFTDYAEKRIYFCCSSCPPEFKNNPDKFMEQMREQGVILEDVPA